MRARIVWLVAVAALIVVVIVVSAAAHTDRDEGPVSYAANSGGPQWHPHMAVICVQVQDAPGFPIEASALAFADQVDTIGRADCEDRPFVIEVVTVIEPEESWAGWWNSVRDDDGYVEGGTIRLNVARAWQMEPGDWRVFAAARVRSRVRPRAHPRGGVGDQPDGQDVRPRRVDRGRPGDAGRNLGRASMTWAKVSRRLAGRVIYASVRGWAYSSTTYEGVVRGEDIGSMQPERRLVGCWVTGQ